MIEVVEDVFNITIGDATGSAGPANDVEPARLPPCPRRLRTDGTYESGGICYGCGACLVPVFEPWA